MATLRRCDVGRAQSALSGRVLRPTLTAFNYQHSIDSMIPDHGDPDRGSSKKQRLMAGVERKMARLEKEAREANERATRFQEALHAVARCEYEQGVCFFNSDTDPALLRYWEFDVHTSVTVGDQTFALGTTPSHAPRAAWTGLLSPHYSASVKEREPRQLSPEPLARPATS